MDFQPHVVSYIFQESDKRDTSLLPSHLNMVGERALSFSINDLRYARSHSLTSAARLAPMSVGGGWNIRIVGGHADANGDGVPYRS